MRAPCIRHRTWYGIEGMLVRRIPRSTSRRGTGDHMGRPGASSACRGRRRIARCRPGRPPPHNKHVVGSVARRHVAPPLPAQVAHSSSEEADKPCGHAGRRCADRAGVQLEDDGRPDSIKRQHGGKQPVPSDEAGAGLPCAGPLPAVTLRPTHAARGCGNRPVNNRKINNFILQVLLLPAGRGTGSDIRAVQSQGRTLYNV